MEMKQVSDNCFAVLNEKNRVCDANSGLINQGGGVVIDTQADLPHGRQMIEMFSKVWPAMPRRVVNTHEDSDHVFGNQLFKGAEIIAHRSVPERMKLVANPEDSQQLQHGVTNPPTRQAMEAVHPGLVAAGLQLAEDFNFDGIELVLPTTLFDTTYELDLDGLQANLIYVGPVHQVGDTIIHVPKEGVVFAGDVLFRQCTPMGWTGSYDKWFHCIDLLVQLKPEVIVPGHGTLCGIEGATDLKTYLQYVRDESKTFFDAGLTSLDAAKRIEFGPYSEWVAPARLYMNVERAYREFRNEPPDAPWDKPGTFDAIYELAKAKGVEVEF
jgi:glyoxylase-like metal-dependent hydrolase (beta-lactamase superfamily II)